MGNKKKQLQQQKITPQNDTFDVKSNLKKLGSSFDRNSYMRNGTTEDDYLSSGVSEDKSVSSYQNIDLKTNFELHTLKQDKKFTDELFSLKESVHVKINQDLKDVKKEFDKKIDSKIDNTYFFGAISVIVVITGLIYILSYQPMINKVDSIEKENVIIKDTVKSIRFDLTNKKR